MLDSRFRAMLGPALDAAGQRLATAGVPPVALTGAGWAAGAGACAATALRAWPVALGLWLANRLADGLAGPVARASGSPSEAGGFLDIVADLSVYAGVILGLAVGVPAARLACVGRSPPTTCREPRSSRCPRWANAAGSGKTAPRGQPLGTPRSATSARCALSVAWPREPRPS